MEDNKLITIFGQDFYWDIVSQGAIFTIASLVSFFILFPKLFNDILEKRDSIKKTFKQVIGLDKKGDTSVSSNTNELAKWTDTLISSFIDRTFLISLGVLFSFTVGLVFNPISDIWMDMPSYWHLCLKSTWNENSNEISKNFYDNLDGKFKLKAFNEVFRPEQDDTKLQQYVSPKNGLKSTANKVQLHKVSSKTIDHYKEQSYYAMKHYMIYDNKWSRYLEGTQIYINICQVISFSSFIIFLSSLISIPIRIIEYRRKKNDEQNVHLKISIFLCLFFFIIYWSASKSWVLWEYESDYKVYSVLSLIDGKFNSMPNKSFVEIKSFKKLKELSQIE